MTPAPITPKRIMSTGAIGVAAGAMLLLTGHLAAGGLCVFAGGVLVMQGYARSRR